MNTENRVAIIGAGCSGLTAIKNMLQVGLKNVTCFEQNPWIGGNWKYTGDSSHSSVCATTHIISSKKLSEYVDFPMPEEYPDYPSHEQVLQYLESYAEHFELKPYIRFNSKVLKAEKIDDDTWSLSIEDGTSEVFDFLIVANGHHSEPRHPTFNGKFEGKYMHAHDFKTTRRFEDQSVLVIGAGNSACDCAVEISRVASNVDLSIRTPQYIIPKFFLGKPTDTFNEKMLWVPKFIKNVLLKLSLKIQVGNYEDYGLNNPQHGILEAHPTLNSELLYKIRHGKVNPKPAINRVNGNEVFFDDGSSGVYDIILAATGYKIETPFFDKDFLDYSDADRVPLYLKMFHPIHRTLFFVGLFQPQGAVWPASDLQSQLLANHIIGNYHLPENIEIRAEREADLVANRFLKRKRHTIEVDYHEFVTAIRKQIPKNASTWANQLKLKAKSLD